ncbi:ADP-ribosyl-(dinitrogen reductase) hydrolase [Aliidiomarina quisquiliarum]|uniref:ADP-ribosyl-(dinitrogen reductase) hydrolase n=1 Tax=Aliidiomarina quisquiliarum TaxID=2938947 RepID=UPI00208F5A84|nr:ADP-ribosyl-(dinitrogen reductase) hydrolase [Aliidiomarina quisquiliarum]MCO4320369.1 ADP-ribosyl-(dinitrogen reductase) hydrolase [Aliidiomarina quisquiliarum]
MSSKEPPPLQVSERVREKLLHKHNVTMNEVREAFGARNSNRKFLTDNREDHKTNPPTLWFIAQTDRGRDLKISFIVLDDGVHLKSVYEPNSEEIRIYNKYS